MIKILYYYESNKLTEKEEYESAYLAGLLKNLSNCDVICRTIDSDLKQFINSKTRVVFIKPYNKNSLDIIKKDIKDLFNYQDDISVYMFGTFAKTNCDEIMSDFQYINGIITDDLESQAYYICNSIINKDIVPYINHNKNNIPLIINDNFACRQILHKINQKFAEVSFSNGCLRSCKFCTEKDKIYKEKSLKFALDELEYLYSEFNIKNFTIKDLSFEDHLKGDENFLEDFASELLRKKMNIKYNVHFRADTFSQKDTNLLKLLRSSGLFSVLLGVESFLDCDLKLYGKSATSIDNINTIKLLKECNIEPFCSFIILNPYTNIKDILDNLSIIYDLELLDFLPPLFNTLKIYNSTKLFEKLKNENKINSINKYEFNILYDNKSVEKISSVLDTFYSNKSFWDLYHPIKHLHLDLQDFKFKYNSNILFSKNLVENAELKLKEINEFNYLFMKDLIQSSLSLNYKDLYDKVAKHNNSYKEKYYDCVREYRKLVLKEIRGNELLQSIY